MKRHLIAAGCLFAVLGQSALVYSEEDSLDQQKRIEINAESYTQISPDNTEHFNSNCKYVLHINTARVGSEPVQQYPVAHDVTDYKLLFPATIDPKLYESPEFSSHPTSSYDFVMHHNNKSYSKLNPEPSGTIEGLHVITGENIKLYQGKCH